LKSKYVSNNKKSANPCARLSSSPLLWRLINFWLFCSDDCRSWPREEKFWSDDCWSWPREEKINNHGCWGRHAHIPDNDYWGICLFHVVWTNFFLQLFLCGTHVIYIFFFPINWTLRMSDNLPERVQILCHAHIICITVLENRIICCQIFCDLLLKSAFEQIFKVKIKWHIKWNYLIQKFHDICLSYYLKVFVFFYLSSVYNRPYIMMIV
jgi:hypothetical protein